MRLENDLAEFLHNNNAVAQAVEQAFVCSSVIHGVRVGDIATARYPRAEFTSPKDPVTQGSSQR
jgi:hypothetical protein